MTQDNLNEVPELSAPTDADWKRAHDALMAAFAAARVFYGWIDGPFGKVFLAKTDEGLCRVSFRRGEDELVDDLEQRELLPERSSGQLDSERRQFEEYFEGRRQRFELPVDLRWGTPFQRKVLEAANEIPFGQCACYTDIAERIGHPRAQRAVGNALGKNPVAIVIPCHRVVASGGRLGGYTGGLDIKRTLMDIEGIHTEEVS
jgi:methylated-DNA-[protein]-cysteine S-methyltransferase